ncbi:MAG: TlpA family protein disulfide reductase [Alphaproteobacteria bacterium]
MSFGRLHDTAKELRVPVWIDALGMSLERPLALSDLGGGMKIIYCFQDWCPGCHQRGFPTLKLLHDELKDKGVGFAAIQTVFEGADVNTADKLRINQERYGLALPFGHDPAPKPGQAPGDGNYPTFMEDYRSAGTPWFTVIDPQNTVVFADFRLDARRFLEALEGEDLEMTNAREGKTGT